MAKLENTLLSDVSYLCDGDKKSENSRYLALPSSASTRLTYNHGDGVTRYPLLASDDLLADSSFAGCICTSFTQMPPGTCVVELYALNQGLGIRGIDCGTISCRFEGKERTFQIIQGSFIPFKSLDASYVDCDVKVYFPPNLVEGFNNAVFLPCFLCYGQPMAIPDSTEFGHAFFASQPVSSPFKWNNGKPYVQLEYRGTDSMQQVYYTIILA